MQNLRYYGSIFLRRLPYFLIVATVISAAAVIAALALPPAYVSQMKLIVESPRIPDELAASTASTPAQEQLQIVEQRLLTRANLLDIANRLNVLLDQDQMNPDQIVRAMRARTEIDSNVGRNLVALMTVSFEAPAAITSSQVLNEYLTLIQQQDVQSRTGRASQTLEFFEQEVARLSERLAERSAMILEFKTTNSDALPESVEYRLSQQSLQQERLTQIEREIRAMQDQRERLVQIYESTGQVAGTNNQAMTPERQQLEVLRRELNEALVVYSAENPRVKLLQARIEQIEQIVAAQPAPAEETQSTGNSLLDVQLAEISARLSVLTDLKQETSATLEKLSDTLARTPANSIKLDELQLDYENVQLQYNTAVNRLSRASTGERIEVMARGQRISVIEPPATPNQPTRPNRTLIASGGIIFGILAGIGVVLLLEVLNQTVRRPQDLQSKLGITPLTTIPYIRTRGEVFRQRAVVVFWVLAILVGVPFLVYAVHIYYQPLDLIAERIMNKLGVRW